MKTVFLFISSSFEKKNRCPVALAADRSSSMDIRLQSRQASDVAADYHVVNDDHGSDVHTFTLFNTLTALC